MEKYWNLSKNDHYYFNIEPRFPPFFYIMSMQIRGVGATFVLRCLHNGG